ncbi:MAG: sensor domain-containing diguanylate cyclase [Actinomycetota bacterium]|nr:sensor domain-containing diguanylate cyclase [Actinomycetota bacterium]
MVELYAQETRLPEGPLLDVLGNIGAQIGQFLVRRRARDEVAAQTRDLARVAEATRALAREADPERMAPAICATVREVAGTLTASLWRADGPDRLVNLAAAGLPEQVSLPRYLASTPHGALEALRSGRPVFVPDSRGDPRCDAAMVEAIGCASVLFEPVVNGDGPLGVLAVTWAQRHERLAGDLLARYGGEEFGLVMPGCDLDAAEALVERLRGAIPDSVTCSAGLVAWDGLEAADALVARADGALYAAKHTGRDQLVAA